MATIQAQVTDRILICNVCTTIDDNHLRKELLKSYRGIKHVQRWYHKNEFQTPKELVQIDFTSPKYTKTLLEDGFINIGNLRCQVKALQPSMRLRNQVESDYGSDYQSDMLTEEHQITDKILVHDVSTNIADDDFGRELSKTYRGIRHVKRWYYTDGLEAPTERVQIYFESPEDTETILQDGFIEIGQLCWPVTALQPSMYLRYQLDSDYGSDCQSEIFIEDDRVTDRILVYEVPTTIDVNDLQDELTKNYQGIKQVIRWCFDDLCQFPMVCVQIDFISPEYTEAILQDGFIVDGKNYRKVKALKRSMYRPNVFGSSSGSDYQS